MSDDPRALRAWLRRRAAWLAVCALAPGAVLLARDYGVAWDEGVQSTYARLALEYFRSFGRDTRCNDYLNLKLYSPLVDALAAALDGLVPARWFVVRHAVGALSSLLVVPALVSFGRLLGSASIGWLASLALLAMPVFVGQAFVNLKDAPLAAAFAWASLGIARFATRGDHRLRAYVGLGALLGACLAVRPGMWIPLLALQLGVTAYADLSQRARLAAHGRSAWKLLAAFALAWALMIAPWPYAHGDPWLHPLSAIRTAMQFHATYPVLFDGQVLSSAALPRRYLLQTFAITTPLPTLLATLAGSALVAAQVWRAPKSPASVARVALLAWALGPLVLWTLLRPNIYDGNRHFLFVLPAWALLSALAGQALIAAARAGSRRVACAALVALLLAWGVPAAIRLHPYQAAYFNELVGGVGGADGRYETEYFATSYREALEWISARASSARPARVLVAANAFSKTCAEPFAGDRITLQLVEQPPRDGALPADADYYVATYRYGAAAAYPDTPIAHVVGRGGATFTVVRGRSR